MCLQSTLDFSEKVTKEKCLEIYIRYITGAVLKKEKFEATPTTRRIISNRRVSLIFNFLFFFPFKIFHFSHPYRDVICAKVSSAVLKFLAAQVKYA